MTHDKLAESEMPLTKGRTKTRKPATRRLGAPTSRAHKTSKIADRGEVLTLAEAAKYLRVSQEEVVRSIGPAGLPGRRFGDDWRFLKSALQAWLAMPPAPSSQEALRSLAGAWKDDPFLDELRQKINAEREGLAGEEGE